MNEYFDEDDAPLKCTSCGCTEFVEKVISVDGGCVSEKEINCRKCGIGGGYWAYGRYDPAGIMSLQETIEVSNLLV